MDDGPTDKRDTCRRLKQKPKLNWVRVVANYLCTVPPGIPVTLVGLETHNTYGLECPSVPKALTTTKDYVASHVKAICEASGRKADQAAILKRLRFFDMRTWVDSELDEADISKVEARKWVTDWDAFALGQAARALKPKTKKPRLQ